ncbi:unnamed protein product [Cladocopium goreaui]|uniref:cAMP-dependent protein kinase type I-alpha regulatory subunit n=1 Tax=Cladocopium goreaui TaxID=2562237 RepID=A0A9P1FYI5_9DINO|nr:unnamed protein product [Cladocopium goreaui]
MSIQGAGSLVNGAGFLRLINEARIYKQRNPTGAPARPRPARSQGYDVHGYSGPPPAIYMDFRGPPKQPEDYDGPDDVTMAFYNTCPYACRSSQSSSNGWMSLAVTGALPGEQPGKAGAALPKGGATVSRQKPARAGVDKGISALLMSKVGYIKPGRWSLQKIQDMLDRRSNTGVRQGWELGTYSDPSPFSYVELNIKSLGNFGINCEEIHGNWTEIMEKFQLTVFPGAPSEAMYALASVARSTLVPKGSFVVSEGETGEDADALVLLVSGVASVLKKAPERQGEVRVEDHVLEQQTVGRLRGGAIIGDISLIGASMPRPATVRAKTDVEAIVFPGRSVLAVLAAFPTLLNPATDRLVDTAECIKERLLTKTEVASSLNLFYGCDLGFVNDVASNGERRLLFAGETVVQQGSTVGTLFVLEHGRVSIQISGVGTVNEVPAGNCFGERTLLGIAAEANATVRVATPFALALAILRTALHKALKKHPVEVEHFEKLKTSPQGGRISGSKVRHVELFRASGTGFLEALNAKVTSAMFLSTVQVVGWLLGLEQHGQTIVVEGSYEEDPAMFVLSGGIVVAERHGHAIARISPGATFGELAMLGVSPERAVTIRAVTLCFIMSIQSSAFHQALEKFPEEKERFDTATSGSHKEGPRVVWPCLRGESSRLLYLLDLYAEKFSCLAGDRRLGHAPFNEAAILILEGEISVLDPQGRELAVLTAGCCWNERILAGARAEQTERLLPITNCEVRIVNRETWGKVMAEFPSDLGKVRAAILRYMGEQAEKRLGYEPGSSALLQQRTAFFSAVSNDFAKQARAMAETRIVEPGCDIVPESLVTELVVQYPGLAAGVIFPYGDSENNDKLLQFIEAGASHDNSQDEAEDEEEDLVQELYIFLQGDATLTCPLTGERAWQCGEVMGESPFAGTTRLYPARVTANTVCLVQVYKKNEIFEAMAKQEGRDRELSDDPGELALEAQPFGLSQMRKRLQRSFSFRNAHVAFSSALVRLPDVVLFPPNRLITEQGDECKLGESQFFLVLVGRVKVAGAVGTLFSMVGAGQVFGEVGAFGISKRRTASACTWQEGYVSCLRFTGAVVRAAVNEFPLDRDKLAQIWKRTEVMNRSTELERREWIKTTAIPALAQTPLLGGCPPSFFHSLSVLLQEQLYKSNSEIVKCGDKLEHMILLVAGAAQLRTRVGDDIGMMRKGSMFGEINALGLFNYSMATIQSTERTRLLVLPHAAMKQALASPAAKQEGICVAFQKLVDGRYDQVDRGVPLCGMGITTQKDDPRVRAIALLAERRDLEAGDEWCPVPDSEPAGPFFGVLVSGRVMVEIGPEHHIVLQLTSGAIFPEGLLASYGAVCRAETTCEAYRVRWHDFYMAVGLSTPSATDWFWKFRVQEKATVERLTRRLQSVQGLLHVNVPHRKDEEIQAWKAQRGERISQAKRMSSTLAVQVGYPVLMGYMMVIQW